MPDRPSNAPGAPTRTVASTRLETGEHGTVVLPYAGLPVQGLSPAAITLASGHTDEGSLQLLRDIAAAPCLQGQPLGAELAQQLVEQISGRYTIGPRLGAGAMGVVYRAQDKNLHREVALKVLSDDLSSRAESRERFVREARMAARIVSPHVASIYELGASDGGVFIAMELVEGRTLRALLREGVPGVERATVLALQLAEGLAAAHDAGVIHRDLKPENIMVTSAGQAKILDFGLARLDEAEEEFGSLAAPLTRSGVLMGTPPYMSPEQLCGEEPDFRSDVYSLGLVLYELFVGQRLFRERSVDAIRKESLAFDPRSLSASLPAPPAMTSVITRCLSPKEHRYRDAGELLAALQAARSVPRLPTVSEAPGVALSSAPPGAVSLPFSCPRCGLRTTAQVGVSEAELQEFSRKNRGSSDVVACARSLLSGCWCPRCGAPPEGVMRGISEWEERARTRESLRRGVLLGILATGVSTSGGCVACVVASPPPGDSPSGAVDLALFMALPLFLPFLFAALLSWILLAPRRRPELPRPGGQNVRFDPPSP